jgi:hypothetical protein
MERGGGPHFGQNQRCTLPTLLMKIQVMPSWLSHAGNVKVGTIIMTLQ